jgi:hypothetical protein
MESADLKPNPTANLTEDFSRMQQGVVALHDHLIKAAHDEPGTRSAAPTRPARHEYCITPSSTLP